jgi:predicted DNA-binding transcriptional regulator
MYVVSKDQALGFGMMIISIVVILIYGWLVFLSEYALLILKLTGFIAVAGVFGILAWIGYTLASTPPPKPIEEIEKEIEEELKKLESETQKTTTAEEGKPPTKTT